ncbi:anti-sigma factor [Microbacter sp. GSS18]|nr:anti-sigma factor [Microbacter sp. GSS18]
MSEQEPQPSDPRVDLEADPPDEQPADPESDPPSQAPAAEPAPTTSVIQAVSRRNWTRGLIAFAVALILLVGLGFGAARLNDYLMRSPAEVALADIEASADEQSMTAELVEGGTATVAWSESLGTAVFFSEDLPALDEGETFALWLTRGASDTVVAQFAVDGREVVVQLDQGVEAGDLIALTIESGSEAPDERSGDAVVTIPTS